MFDLTGKVAIVTGSGKGVGKGIARCLVEAGAKVCLNYAFNSVTAKETLREILDFGGPDCAILVKADVSDLMQAQNMVAETINKWGKIDILVNNAALQRNKNFDEYTEEEFDLVFDVNIGGYLNMMQACISELKKTKGSIILISSIHSEYPGNFDPVYSMSKAGIQMLLREATVEFAQYGIRVNMIQPADVKIEFKSLIDNMPITKNQNNGTNFSYFKNIFSKKEKSHSIYPLGREGLPVDSGYLCVFLASKEAAHLTGAVIRLDGGITLI
ncbi:SDR family oxidoreductase [Selenomonadales bacterium OttesenSCG-928-I06]|nr:SDR family oxidoreductase [Selenomonadales bacterium OttesenSCG-928-I06]